MKKPAKKVETLEEYLHGLTKEQVETFKAFSKIVKEVVPDATVRISYQLPAFESNGLLVWFGAFKSHYGLFPKTAAIKAFEKDLKNYKTSKGTIQLPSDKPLPATLIKKIVRFRQKELKEEKQPASARKK